MEPCTRCGSRRRRTAFSVAAGAVLCFDCYGLLPEARTTARAPRYAPPPRRRPNPYERLHERVWAALEASGEAVTGVRLGSVFTRADGSGWLYGWCPSCREGTVAVRLLDNPPRVRVDGCSAGCTDDQLTAALA
jgi:hypothetical protein